MYVIEFETDIHSEYVRIPQFEKLKNRHVKVIVMTDLDDNQHVISQAKRKPASIPTIAFHGDVISTVPTEQWVQG